MKPTITFLPTAALVVALGTAAAVAGGNGPSFTAVVNSDGSLARGLHATASFHEGRGAYEVDFTNNVTSCGYTAAIGLSGDAGSSEPGTVTVVGRSGMANAIYVQTFNKKGKPADLGFHVIVAC